MNTTDSSKPDFMIPPKPKRKGPRRWTWLIHIIRLRKYEIGAEIGCHTGMTTSNLLKQVKNLKLFAVDLWAPTERGVGSGQYQDWNFKWSQNTFKTRTRLYADRLTVLKGLSWEMADKVKDGSLDFVFIDADHSYESVIKDIKAWTPKLKTEGMISGHDTHFPTVKAAIDEIVPNWIDTRMDHCWFARKEDVIL